jgi:hypothetical protein
MTPNLPLTSIFPRKSSLRPIDSPIATQVRAEKERNPLMLAFNMAFEVSIPCEASAAAEDVVLAWFKGNDDL